MSTGPGGEDVLARLEARLDRAASAAEGLIGEAARAARRPPPAGWQAPAGPEERDSGEVLAAALDALRELVPAELQRRLADALRELLLAVRALIDWYLERADRRRREPPAVQEIPID